MNKKPLLLFTLISLFSISSCKKVPVPGEVNLNVTQPEAGFKIHTDEQKLIIESDDPDSIISHDTVTYGKRSNSAPKGLHISYEENNDINQDADKYEILFSESNNFDNSMVFTSTEKSVDIYNLKINTKYYYRVDSIHSGHRFSSQTYEYTINDVAPRNLFVEGVENCRDLGGWTLANNKIYKQGLIYRTAQYNYGGGFNTYVSAPTEQGLKTLVEDLKIKTDIDLRKTKAAFNEDEVNGITSSPLGSSVNYVSCPMIYNRTNIFTREENKASIRLFFDTLADINNYPIAFHCLRGTDRTGGLAYIIGAILGMSEKDLQLDYLFSDLAKIGNPVLLSTIGGDDFYVKGIADSEGATLSEKAKNYLINTCGVSEASINVMVAILTE